jgi:hypothetical protein
MKGIRKVAVPQFLSGWKEIANYLGKGVRTVQRYERELGFPVRRPAGKSHAAVIATKTEIDAWVAASPIRDEFQLSMAQTNSQMAALENIKERLTKMGMLRDQMQALRMELRASTLNLAESIEKMHGEINNRWAGGKTWPGSYSAEMPSLKNEFTNSGFDSGFQPDTSRGEKRVRPRLA